MKTSSHGISRIDQPARRTHCWTVRLGYRQLDEGWRPKINRTFSDRAHGGKRKALIAAREFRDRAVRKLRNAEAR